MKKIIFIIPVVIAGILSAGIMYNISSREKFDPKEVIFKNLEFIENMYIKKLDFRERRTAIQKVDEIHTILNRIGEAAPANSGMPDRTFNLLLKRMKETKWDKDRLVVYTKYSQRYMVSAVQLYTLTETFTFSSAKTDFIRENLQRITSKEEVIAFFSMIDKNLLDDIFGQDHSSMKPVHRK